MIQSYALLFTNFNTHLYTNNSVFQNDNFIIIIYIDNIILICELKMNKIQDLKTKLSNQYKMMNCRSCKHYLKMHITHNRILWTFILLQKTYLKKMFKTLFKSQKQSLHHEVQSIFDEVLNKNS
jgi:hypothetical protein